MNILDMKDYVRNKICILHEKDIIISELYELIDSQSKDKLE